MSKHKLLALFAAAFASIVLGAASTASATPPPWAHGGGGGGGGGGGYSIDLVAPWGNAALVGSDSLHLTYSVNGSSGISSSAVQAARDAAAAWAGWFPSHDGSGTFSVTQAVGGNANVPITFKKGGGTTAGVTKFSFDQQGFISGATVQISAKSFGTANDYGTVYEITLHELGHALVGLGHSTDPNDLMYPVLNGTSTIGNCESSGFDALYGWLRDGSASTGPALPSSSPVSC